jgi:hypothetical protein
VLELAVITFGLGFAAGFGVREYLSRRRRDRQRLQKERAPVAHNPTGMELKLRPPGSKSDAK